MSSRPTVFTEDAAREIKRQVLRGRRAFSDSGNDLTGGGRHQTAWQSPHRIRFKNAYAGTCPHRAVMRITGGSTDGYLTCNRPDSTYRWLYVVNIDGDVGQSRLGWCSFLTLESFQFENSYVLYDTNDGTPAYGERWGPKADSWLLGQHRPGFFVFGVNTGSGSTARTLTLQLPPAEVRVKNDTGSAIAAAGTGTVSLFGGSAGTTDLGMDLAITNGMSIEFANGKYGSSGNVNGKDWVITWQT